jgi:SAM-dependent methyltransferase
VTYVHGYHERESERLDDQAGALVDLLHHDTAYPAGSRVLEAGCGIGSQTVTLAANSPGANIISIDVSEASLDEARQRVSGVDFQRADIFALPFAERSFDHVFVCFVLEHLQRPVAALRHLARVVKPGGTFTVIEGDHGSTSMHPPSEAAHEAIDCLVRLQHGDATIGRALYPLLVEAGLQDVRVSPRMVYVDGSRPELAESFTRRTFAAMIEGVRGPALDAGLIDADRFDQGIGDLHRAAEPDGTFCYTFFKATAAVPA